MKVLVTGAKGFIGSNLIVHLQHREDVQIFGYDIDNSPGSWMHGWTRPISSSIWRA